MKITKIIIISVLFVVFLTIPALASSYNVLADFGSDHGSLEKDGVVDFEDLMIFSQAYGSTPSDPNWNPVCDICGQSSSDPDGTVDFEDLMPLADSFGEREEKEWTVMLYMAGDSSLSINATVDLDKIRNALSPNSEGFYNLNFIAQVDYKTDQKIYRYHLNHPTIGTLNSSDVVQTMPELNMSAPENLTNFINWAKEKFPAKYYTLVLWGHGSGWHNKSSGKGILTDDTSDDIMSISQLASALENANQRMDLVIGNSCLMQSLEVVYELKSLVNNNLPDYFIASQQSVWGFSLPWHELTDYLCNNYTASVDDFCKKIIERYIQLTNCDPNWGTISAVNMNDLDLNNIEEKINNFADALLASQYQLKIQQTISETQSVKSEDYKNFKDLKHFAQNIVNNGVSDCNNEAFDIISMVTSMFPFDYEKHVNGGNVDNCHGINIELPTNSSDYMGSYESLNFAENTHWDEFIQRNDNVDNVGTVAVTEHQSGSVINAVKISWDSYEGATSYKIDKSIDGFNFENFETTETTFYDYDIQEGTGYIYYVSAIGPFGITLPSQINIIEPRFLPACYLDSPSNDPEGQNPITNPSITFQWNSLNISCPYKGIDDIDGMVILYDITEGDKEVWYKAFENDLYTSQAIFNGEGKLIEGHKYKWLYKALGFENYNTITISRSQEWEFTYGENIVAADISGYWSGEYSTSLISGYINFVEIEQNGNIFQGQYNDSNGVVGELSGEFISENNFNFTLTQTNIDCTGVFEGSGIIDGDTITINFSGTNCLGTHSNGTGQLERITIIEPPVEFRGGVAWTLHSTRSRSITRGTLNDDSSRVLYYSGNLGDTLSRGGIYHAVDVSWLAYDNCTGYRVYRSTNGMEYEMILNWDTTGIIGSAYGLYDSDIVLGNTYSYYFTAYNDTENWETVPSNIYTIEIDNETFLPPIYLNQPQDYGQVDDPNYIFKWTPVGDILPYGDFVTFSTSIRVFDSVTLDTLWWENYDDFTTSQATYNGASLINGNIYRWDVKSYGYDANGQIIVVSESEDWEFTYIANDIIDGQITDISPLTNPFDLDAWYTTNVYVKNTGNVSHTFKVRGLKPSGTDFQDGTEKFLTIDPGATKSVPFTYQFYGTETCRSLTFYLYDNSGNLLDTKQTGTLCPNVTYPPDAPTLNDFIYCPWSGVNYSLTWSNESSSGAVSYNIQESRYSDFRSIISDKTTTSTSYTYNHSVTENTYYYYRVRSKNSEGVYSEEWSNPVEVIVMGIPKASITVVTRDHNGSLISGGISYILYDDSNPWNAICNSGSSSSNSYTFDDLEVGTYNIESYKYNDYSLQGYYAAKVDISLSEGQNKSITIYTSAIAVCLVDSNDNFIPSDGLEYVLYLEDGSGNWRWIKTVIPYSNNYTFTKIPSGIYNVEAYTNGDYRGTAVDIYVAPKVLVPRIIVAN